MQVTGSKAPQLKRLGQWLMENPMFDVDPKWAELVKERGNLPHDLQKRLPGSERNGGNKGKSPGRPPMMPSPTGQQSMNPANLAATSMASSLNFPSLSNINSSILSGLSLGNFDPKNNPLLIPFGGLPNLGALGGLGNLGSLSNMSLTNSLFANLAGLGLPSLAGMEAALGATATSTADTNVVTSASSQKLSTSTSSSSKSRTKMEPPTSKSSAPSTSTSSTLPTTAPFPFFFTNPSLLYTPLGLGGLGPGGLGPFSMQPGSVSSTYESLAQCGLLNTPTSSASTSSSTRKSTSASSSSRRDIEQIKRKEPEKKPRYPTDGTSLQQFVENAQQEERKRIEAQEKREAIELAEIADLSARIERKTKEQEMKEALEQLSRTSAELLTRNLDERPSSKRARDAPLLEQPQIPSSLQVTLEPVGKKMKTETKVEIKVTEPKSVEKSVEAKIDLKPEEKEEIEKSVSPPPPSAPIIEPPTIATTVDQKPEDDIPPPPSTPLPLPQEEIKESPPPKSSTSSVKEDSDQQSETVTPKTPVIEKSAQDEEETKCPKTKKSRGGKRLNIEPPPERKNLRSSAGRQARAAAERQARMEGEQQQQAEHPETHSSVE